ncbi:MAG: AI-2E family transporter [Nanoarchaeota archaeon]|nr:AI-2E family transporter [Nanoarchaeota archaeon]MBU1854960.1 AI-2E family transporter [Nanoarchaeota archaeon]
MKKKVSNYFLISLLIIFLYLTVITILPVLKSVLLSFILAFIFYPVYKNLKKKIKSDNWCASIMIFLVLLIIIIPGFFIVNALAAQTISAYSYVVSMDLGIIDNLIPEFLKDKISFDVYVDEILLKIKDLVINYTPEFIGSVAETTLGLFVMFFVMFYAFRDGKELLLKLKNSLPLKKKYINKLFNDTEKITAAVLYGYVLTAVIQGSLGGLTFFFLGISNSVFWGFVMIILSLIPFLGTPIVWLPAAIIELLNVRYFNGLFLLIFGFIVLLNIDNFLRPKLIGKRSKVHPAVILVGVIGGLAVFGFLGIIIGPMVLTLFGVLIKFFMLEFN